MVWKGAFVLLDEGAFVAIYLYSAIEMNILGPEYCVNSALTGLESPRRYTAAENASVIMCVEDPLSPGYTYKETDLMTLQVLDFPAHFVL